MINISTGCDCVKIDWTLAEWTFTILGIVDALLIFFPLSVPSSSSRILAESQNYFIRRSQGLGRHKRKNATEEGRATHAGERGETRDKAAASCGRQAGPQHAATTIVSPTYIQSRYAFKSPADF